MPQDPDRPFHADDRCLASPRHRAVRYRPSFETDIRLTFERERKRLKAEAQAALPEQQAADSAPAPILAIRRGVAA